MNRDHWFWKYAYENKGVYIQGGIATLMVNLFALVIGFFVMVALSSSSGSNSRTYRKIMITLAPINKPAKEVSALLGIILS